MKKPLFTLCLYLLSSFYLNAQTNTFPTSGNVGIGTTNPISKLTIHTDNTQLNMQGLGGVFGYGINVNTTGGWARNYSFSSNGNVRAHMGALGVNNSLTYLYFDTNDETDATGYQSPEMVITKIGNVGIGTTTPDSKLSVNGNIHTKEVKVDLIGWSDFVFAKDYDLPNLKEVEQHIKEKGHLKDIPSAEDVKENGIFLGEMDAKLLQKIEELTLYAIDQEKRIEALESKNKDLEKENIELKSLSDRLEDIEELLNNKNNKS